MYIYNIVSLAPLFSNCPELFCGYVKYKIHFVKIREKKNSVRSSCSGLFLLDGRANISSIILDRFKLLFSLVVHFLFKISHIYIFKCSTYTSNAKTPRPHVMSYHSQKIIGLFHVRSTNFRKYVTYQKLVPKATVNFDNLRILSVKLEMLQPLDTTESINLRLQKIFFR